MECEFSINEKFSGTPIDQNSLYFMPVHIIDAIFTCLDLIDAKSLSETCKKFNSLFSAHRHLQKVWLKFDTKASADETLMQKVNRRYSNLVCDKSMPISIVEHFSTNLKGMKVKIPWTISIEERQYALQENPFDDFNLNRRLPHTPLESFAAIIPHFVNLTELEIMRLERKQTWYFFDSGELTLEHTRARRVEMKHLKFLTIEIRFFDFLSTHMIDFKPSDKIEKLTFYGPGNTQVMRTFIAQQKNLKELSLDVQQGFFDEPLIVHSKLKKFAFLSWVRFNKSERQARFLNFIELQDELEVLELEGSTFERMNANMQERLKTFRLKSLDLNLKSMKMEFNIHTHVMGKEISKLTASFDVLALKEKPNLAVQNLDVLLVGVHQDQIPNFFSLIASNFPKLTSIEIDSRDNRGLWNFPPVENLTCLKELKLTFYHKLDSINIPKLKTFSYGFCPTETVKVQFDRFLALHAAIENLNIHFLIHDSERTKRCLNDLIPLFVSASKILNELKMISVMGKEIPDISEVKLEWTDTQMTTIAALIEENAKPGFKFCSGGFELLKKDDMKVVRKVEGKWEAFM